MVWWITLLIYAALFVLSDLLSPKPELENAKPAGIGDFQFPTATEQRKVPLLWGTVRISGPNVVWWGDLEQEPITEKVKTGLFSSETVTKGFHYHIGMQQALCEGPVDDLVRVWVDEDLVMDESAGTPVVHDGTFLIDEPELFGGEDLGNGGFVGTFKFHSGTTTQAVSSYLSAFQKFPVVTGDTPAYRGVCYTAPSSERVYVGNSSSIKPMKWEVRRQPNQLALTSNKHQVNTWDANPAAVLYEIMTNVAWGYGISSSLIDAADFRTAGDTLFDEGNGFSMIVDRDEDIGDLIQRIEAQIDGVTFQDPASGLWKLKLARDDYDIDTVFALTVDNVKEVVSYTQTTWEDTKNQVSVPFNQRNDEYKGTYGFAQDMANVLIVGKRTPTQIAHPGVKDATLANVLAWREIRALSRPIISTTMIVDRSIYGELPGNVVSFTDPDFNAVKVPLRIQGMDMGDLFKGEIRVQMVEDVFDSGTPSFADPPQTGWEPPSDTLVAFPSDEQIVFEAPRAFTSRTEPDPNVDKVWACARRQGPEAIIKIRTRQAVGGPTGAYEDAGTIFGFIKIGELQSALTPNSAYPLASFVVLSTPDTQGDILNAFPTVSSIEQLGQDLPTLIYIGGEFMLVTSAQASVGNVQLNNVYRAIADSAQLDHAANADVYLLFVGGNMTDFTYTFPLNVDVKLIPVSSSDELAEASAVTVALAMNNRVRRPYPPSEFDINGVRLDITSVNLAGGGGSGESAFFTIDAIIRRDYRVTDEIPQLSTDAGTLFADYPTANTTTHLLVVLNGATELIATSIGTAVTGNVLRLDVLDALDEVSLPASLTLGVRASHTHGGTVYTSLVDCTVVAALTDTLIGLHAFGSLAVGVISNGTTTLYAVIGGDDTVDHTLTLSTAFTVGAVEYRINGGSWLTWVAAGATSGFIPNASLTTADTIEMRHLSTDAATKKLATLTVGATTRGYAVLTT